MVTLEGHRLVELEVTFTGAPIRWTPDSQVVTQLQVRISCLGLYLDMSDASFFVWPVVFHVLLLSTYYVYS